MKFHVKTLAGGLTGAATIAALAFLWFKTQSINLAEQAHIDAIVRDLRQLDRTLNQDVLRVRFQFANSYDALAESYHRMDKKLAQLYPPSYLSFEGRAKLERAVASYRTSFESKRRLVERFKSRNAILRNSLRYFPTIATETMTESLQLDADNVLATRINRLLQDILIYNLNADESHAASIRSSLKSLFDDRALYPASLQADRIDILASHAQTILRAKPEVDGLIAQLLTADMTTAENQVAVAFSTGFEEAEREAGQYRKAMYGLCVVLALMVVLMVIRLRLAFGQLEDANARLEEKVAYRTRELDAKNRDLELVLNTVDQGFLTLDRAGCMGAQHSKRVEQWLGSYRPGTPFWDYLSRTDSEAATWFQLGFDDLITGIMPEEVVLNQMPRQLIDDGRHLRLDYKSVRDGDELVHLLVTISDVTMEVEQRAKARQEREMVDIVRQFMRDRAGFREFLSESQKLVNQMDSGDFQDTDEAMRIIHTLKGNCAIYGVLSFSDHCHTLESRLVETGRAPSQRERATLVEAWNRVQARVRPIVETGRRDTVEVTHDELHELRSAIASGSHSEDLLGILDKWNLEPATHRLSRIADRAKGLAQRLGRPHMGVVVEADQVRLDSTRMAGFWGSFVHVVRNAVDHGIESVEERIAAGKSEDATLTLRAQREGDGARIEIVDDGRGIEWNAIADIARARGLAHQTKEELVAAMCSPGVSTKEAPTAISGRGVGMNAIVEATRQLDGEMCVRSEPGRGTSLTFRLPHVAEPDDPDPTSQTGSRAH